MKTSMEMIYDNERYDRVWDHTVRMGSYCPESGIINCPPFRIEHYWRTGGQEGGQLYCRATSIYREEAQYDTPPGC